MDIYIYMYIYIYGRFFQKSHCQAPAIGWAPHAEILDPPQRWTLVARQAFQL